jgi:probable HAF family extracellular repeat protein
MKSRTWMWMTVASLFAVLTISVGLTVQAQDKPLNPPQFTAVPLGTLGGVSSNVGAFSEIVNSQEAMVGNADTGVLNPNYTNYNFLIGQNLYIQHAMVTQYFLRQDLGALPGGPNQSVPTWINANNTVVGISENGSIDPLIGIPEGNAVMWKNGQIVNLGTLGGYESVAFAVNGSDQVTGAAANTISDPNSFFGWGTQTRGFFYQNGVITDIGTLGGNDTLAFLINDAGQIAGQSGKADGSVDPFVWTKGKMQDLGGLGGTSGFVDDMNSKGQVVGGSNLAGNAAQHAFFWDGTMMHDLGSLNNGFQTDFSESIWINDVGDIVGYSNSSSTAHHAVLWKNGGAITDLGTLPGDRCSRAWGINNKGQIVGTSGNCSAGVQAQHAVLWQNGQIYDLTDISPFQGQLTSAFYINDRGEIGVVGNTQLNSNGPQVFVLVQRAFLLIPSPPGNGEPEQGGQASPDNVEQRHNRFGGHLHLPGRFTEPVD